ncbi:MAG: M24 family metallopeptidase [Erysipelotrichaceae bacterium]|jgi:Xaa-Pro aminopeptidase|nr:M24 family metallopeptidase [Erysipelotrichaceae bacterium]
MHDLQGKELEARRKEVFKQMKENSIAIFFSGVSKVSSEDEYLPFCVNKNFFYLTNIEQEHSALMMIKAIGEKSTYLFVDPYDELKEKWTGKRISFESAGLISDVKNVYSTENFETMVKLALTDDNNHYGQIDCVYLDLSSPEQKLKDNFFMNDFAMKLKVDHPNKEIVDIYPSLRDLRMIKSPLEVQNITKAIEATNSGISYVLRHLKSGMAEHVFADYFEMYGRLHDRTKLAFSTIVAAGKNATCLHYPTQNDVTKDSDLVLFDLGYRHKQYCADISRTFPISGKFVGLQAKVYEAVLTTNKAVIKYAKPGLLLKDLQDFAIETLKNECLRLGLMTEDDDIRNYYYHGVSHHLGLDTHDVAVKDRPLQIGNVITVEPGLYFAKFGIGVRIEDNVLITEDGAMNLSKNIVKEMDEIERLMASRNV